MMTGPLSSAVSLGTLPFLWDLLVLPDLQQEWVDHLCGGYSASGGMSSGPAALPDFKDLMALLT